MKNVSGRKSDVLDCQWLQQLMTYGLLSGAFRPAEQVCVLRSLWRQRGMLLREPGPACPAHAKGADADEHPAGQRHLRRGRARRARRSCAPSSPASATAQVLGAMKNARIRASASEIAKSLQGNWRAEHLFALKQALALFDFIGTQLAECDREIEAQLQTSAALTRAIRPKARSAAAPAMRRSSICARSCSRCAAWT